MRRFSCFLLIIFFASSETSRAAPQSKEAFRAAINELVGQSQLHVGAAVKDLATGDEFFVNPDASFPLGSSIRIHLIAELYRQAAAKKLSLDDVRALPESARVGGYGVLRYMGRANPVSLSLRDYAILVSTVNDNSAANFLTDVVRIDNINTSLAAQGTPEIKFNRRAISRRDISADTPQNVGTPRAVMRALELLHQGKVVDRATSDAIIDLLAIPDMSYVRRELPFGVRFAGQSGSGPDFRCDEGLVLLPNHAYIVCVMVDRLPERRVRGRRDYSEADRVVSQLSGLALSYFEGDQPDAEKK
jgi:beta-lactamase class A